MEPTTTQLFNEMFGDKLRASATKQLIRYAVQKQMFCPQTKAILDYRTCVLVDVSLDGMPYKTTPVSPSADLTTIKTNLEAINGVTATFSTLNKKLKNDLVTLIK